jgi:tetratricopeptide (TPR) repeat protein
MKTGLRHGIAAAMLILSVTTSVAARADGVEDGAKGRDALLAGNLDEAIRLFNHALASGPMIAKNQAITLNLRANAYLGKGQTAAALADVNESLHLTETPDAHFTRAKILIAQLHYDDAIKDLDKTLQMGSQASDVLTLHGQAQLYAGRPDQAVKDLDQAIKLGPDDALAWRTRGRAYMSLGQDDKAIADETKAIDLDPKNVEAHWLRANTYRYRKKDPAKAVADYSAALKIDPTDSSSRTSRADVYEEMGRYEEAAADYDAAIQQNPNGAFGYWARGRMNLAMGKTAEATADLAKAVNLKPSDAYNVLWLHLARTTAGANDRAEFLVNAARANRAGWPGPLLDYLTGKTEAGIVLAKAGEGDAHTTQLCETHLFFGEDELAKGHRREGLERLQVAAQVCDGGSHEAKLIRTSLHPGGVAPKPVLTPVSNDKPPPKPVRALTQPQPQVQARSQTQANALPLLRGSLQ